MKSFFWAHIRIPEMCFYYGWGVSHYCILILYPSEPSCPYAHKWPFPCIGTHRDMAGQWLKSLVQRTPWSIAYGPCILFWVWVFLHGGIALLQQRCNSVAKELGLQSRASKLQIPTHRSFLYSLRKKNRFYIFLKIKSRIYFVTCEKYMKYKCPFSYLLIYSCLWPLFPTKMEVRWSCRDSPKILTFWPST